MGGSIAVLRGSAAMADDSLLLGQLAEEFTARVRIGQPAEI